MTPLWVLPAFALVGVAMAALVNWGADALPPGSRGARPALWAGQRGSLSLERRSLVTLACLLGAPLLALAFGVGWRALWLLGWSAVFLLIAVVDFEHRLVLNRVLLFGAGVALVASLLSFPPAPALVPAQLGGGVGLALFAVVAAVGRGAMGAGDVKLAGMLGLVLGYPLVLTGLVVGIVFGGVAAAVALLRGRGRKSTIPYGPWLVAGALFALLQAAAQTAA